MRLRLSLLVTFLALAWAGPARSQQVKDPAELLPANVLASVELRQPGPLAREIAALFKGSLLGNVPDSLAPLHTGNPSQRHGPTERFGVVGSLLAPEMVREAGRIRGAALAITGFDRKHKIPEFVLVVLPGESNVPGFALRMFLANYSMGYATATPVRPGGRGPGRTITQMRASFEPVETVAGVKLYRFVRHTTTFPPERKDAPPEAPKVKREIREDEPAAAMMPGALLLGSPSAVKDVILRLKGKVEAPSLASVKAYQEARRQLGNEPGLFAYGKPSGVFAMIKQLAGNDDPHVQLIQSLLNPKAFRTVAGSIGLQGGNLTYRVRCTLDPEEKSPLLEALPKKAVATELLHAVPRNTFFFAALANDRGAQRWERLLKLADKLSQEAHPDKPAPSRRLAELGEKLKIKIGKDVMARIADVAFAVVGPKSLTAAFAGKERMPGGPPESLILRATSADDAKALTEEVLPKLADVLPGKPDKKRIQKIDGQEIHLLPNGDKKRICYGRQGDIIVLGSDPKHVAAWLKNSAGKGGLLADAKVAAEVKKLDEPDALAVLKPMTMAAGFFLFESLSEPAQPAPPEAVKSSNEASSPPNQPRPQRHQKQKREAVPASTAAGPPQEIIPQKMMKLVEIMEKENPLVVGLMRKPDHLQIEARYTGLRKLVPALVDLAIMANSQPGPPRAVPRPDIKPSINKSIRPDQPPPIPREEPIEPRGAPKPPSKR